MTGSTQPAVAAPASTPAAPDATLVAPLSAAGAASATGASRLKLPDACTWVQTDGGTAVAVCQQPPETLGAKLVGSLPATAISLVALVVAVLAYRYNRTKDARAREQSIEDDFWLRKVVSPMSIEPFLKHMQQAAATLPQAAGSTPDAVKQFWKAQTDKFEELTIAFQTLGLIDEALGSSVLSAIEPLEEEFATYCGALCEYLEGQKPGAPDRAAAVSRLTTHTISVLKLVKAHQERVGQRA